MKVNVYHAQRNCQTGDVENQVHVAVVNYPYNDTSDSGFDFALEYAYRWTNNLTGSWSKKIGDDANDDVDVLVTREDDMGLRSSMVGDQFVIEATSGDRSLHEVGMFGFKSLVA